MSERRQRHYLVTALWVLVGLSAAAWAVAEATWFTVNETTWGFGWSGGRVWLEGGWDLRDPQPSPYAMPYRMSRLYGFGDAASPIQGPRTGRGLARFRPYVLYAKPRWCVVLPLIWVLLLFLAPLIWILLRRQKERKEKFDWRLVWPAATLAALCVLAVLTAQYLARAQQASDAAAFADRMFRDVSTDWDASLFRRYWYPEAQREIETQEVVEYLAKVKAVLGRYQRMNRTSWNAEHTLYGETARGVLLVDAEFEQRSMSIQLRLVLHGGTWRIIGFKPIVEPASSASTDASHQSTAP